MELTTKNDIQELTSLAFEHFDRSYEGKPLVGDGSDRKIYRLTAKNGHQLVGVVHQDIQENRDFLLVTEAMSRLQLPVPRVYRANELVTAYVMEDLGEQNLAADLVLWTQAGEPAKVLEAYGQAISWLPLIQTGLAKLLAAHLAGRKMGKDQHRQDLDYFEENFVQLMGHQSLYGSKVRQELETLLVEPVSILAQDRFVYRDFQARNFMFRASKLYFLDYQSAMLGNRFYDLASMLYASKAGLSEKQRALLLHQGYLSLKQNDESKAEFEESFYQVLLLRRLRSLGSYGYLGQVKRKPGFLASLQPGVEQVKDLVSHHIPQFTALKAFLDHV